MVELVLRGQVGEGYPAPEWLPEPLKHFFSFRPEADFHEVWPLSEDEPFWYGQVPEVFPLETSYELGVLRIAHHGRELVKKRLEVNGSAARFTINVMGKQVRGAVQLVASNWPRS